VIAASMTLARALDWVRGATSPRTAHCCDTGIKLSGMYGVLSNESQEHFLGSFPGKRMS